VVVQKSRSRDDLIDCIKGACLCVMTFDHFPWNPVARFTYQPFGFFSCAEVFVFLAGYISGWTGRRFLKRTGTLFLVHGFIMIVGLTSALLAAVRHQQFGARAPNAVATYTARALFLAGKGDILDLYIVLLPSVPFVLWCLRRVSSRWVLAGSFALWIAAQAPAIQPWRDQWTYFDPLAWQFLFVLGVVLGNARGARIARTAMWACVAAATAIFVVRHTTGAPAYLVELRDIAPLRLVSFVVFLFPAGVLLRRMPNIRLPAFALLGRHSLAVFTYHLVLVGAPFVRNMRPGPFAPIAAIALVATLWIPALIADARRFSVSGILAVASMMSPRLNSRDNTLGIG
jgi:hypothetical protein